MKKPLLALISIINIAGITCDDLENLLCKNVTGICYDDEDCCSQYCFKSFKWFNGICEPQPSELYSGSDTNKIGICEFHMQTDESEIDYLNNEFDKVNAAHNSLPPYTLIKVSYDRRTIVITVNDRIPRTNGSLLDLSNEAARMLQIRNEQSVLCKIEKVVHRSTTLKIILYALPVLSFIIILVNLI